MTSCKRSFFSDLTKLLQSHTRHYATVFLRRISTNHDKYTDLVDFNEGLTRQDVCWKSVCSQSNLFLAAKQTFQWFMLF